MANIQKRISKDGKVSYRALIRLKGAAPQSATFERLTDARRWVQDTESAIRDGRHFKTSEAKRHTLADTIDRYIREVIPRKPRSASDQTQQLRWWIEAIGFRILADVTPAAISECRAKLLAPDENGKCRSHSTVNRYTAALSHVLTVARKEWGWLHEEPMSMVDKLKEPPGRVRFLNDDERKRLLEACKASRNPYLYPLVILALSTGLRKNEALHLRWNDVDLKHKLVRVVKTKNDQPKGVPLTGPALKLVAGLHAERKSEFVFPSPDGKRPIDIRSAWEAAVTRAAIEDFRFHDLRHSTASYLAMNGASLPEIADVLGHKSYVMVKRYAHLTPGHSAKALSSMTKKVLGKDG